MDGAWDRWLGNVVEVLRAPIAWVESRLFRLVLWGLEFLRDLGIPNFRSELCCALDLLELEVWLSILTIAVRREWFFFACASNFCVASWGMWDASPSQSAHGTP